MIFFVFFILFALIISVIDFYSVYVLTAMFVFFNFHFLFGFLFISCCNSPNRLRVFSLSLLFLRYIVITFFSSPLIVKEHYLYSSVFFYTFFFSHYLQYFRLEDQIYFFSLFSSFTLVLLHSHNYCSLFFHLCSYHKLFFFSLSFKNSS
jgi:hypothetical protein